MGMRVLLIGSGGREHALAWKIAASPLLTKLYAAPGNPGIGSEAELVKLDIADHAAVAAFCKEKTSTSSSSARKGRWSPALPTICVPRASASSARRRRQRGWKVRKASPRTFAPNTTSRPPPMAASRDLASAKAYVEKIGAPIVIKADGLAAGKGVTVAMTLDEARAALDACFDGSFGDAGAEVVVEEFMTGEEASFFCLCDGTTALPFGTAQDHKRVGDGDIGPNTGGMGAYSPAPVMTPEMVERTMREIIEPTMRGMAELGAPFAGILFAGLMITDKGPKLIEYNTRFGDPGMPGADDAAEGRSPGAAQRRRRRPAGAHFDTLARRGGAHRGDGGEGLSRHAGKGLGHPWRSKRRQATALRFSMPAPPSMAARWSPMAAACSTSRRSGKTVGEAQSRAYAALDRIDWPQGFCRRDIGWQAVAREKAGGQAKP